MTEKATVRRLEPISFLFSAYPHLIRTTGRSVAYLLLNTKGSTLQTGAPVFMRVRASMKSTLGSVRLAFVIFLFIYFLARIQIQ